MQFVNIISINDVNPWLTLFEKKCFIFILFASSPNENSACAFACSQSLQNPQILWDHLSNRCKIMFPRQFFFYSVQGYLSCKGETLEPLKEIEKLRGIERDM